MTRSRAGTGASAPSTGPFSSPTSIAPMEPMSMVHGWAARPQHLKMAISSGLAALTLLFIAARASSGVYLVRLVVHQQGLGPGSAQNAAHRRLNLFIAQDAAAGCSTPRRNAPRAVPLDTRTPTQAALRRARIIYQLRINQRRCFRHVPPQEKPLPASQNGSAPNAIANISRSSL